MFQISRAHPAAGLQRSEESGGSGAPEQQEPEDHRPVRLLRQPGREHQVRPT